MNTRDFPLLEAFGGGPADGEKLPVTGSELVVVADGYAWVYSVCREDDGSRFLQLVATIPLAAAA